MYTSPTRASVGRQLAIELYRHANTNALVLGIPRGGVPIAVHVAMALHAELDVLVALETAIAVYVEGMRPVIDLERVVELGLHAWDVDREIQEQTFSLDFHVELFRGHRPFPRVTNRTVILVDDGTTSQRLLAAATALLHARGAESLVLARPPRDAFRDLDPVRDVDVILQLNRVRSVAHA